MWSSAGKSDYYHFVIPVPVFTWINSVGIQYGLDIIFIVMKKWNAPIVFVVFAILTFFSREINYMVICLIIKP